MYHFHSLYKNTKYTTLRSTHFCSMEFGKSLCLSLALLSFFISSSHALKFNVGGNDGWVTNPREDYNKWAERNRFLVNDTLFFKYKKGSDSVLLVNKDDYNSCNTKKPLLKLDSGDSEFKFDRSGPFYFISGNPDHCQKGQKLIVVVLHEKRPPPSTGPPTTRPPKSPSPATQPPSTSPPTPSAHPPRGSSQTPATSPSPSSPYPPKGYSPVPATSPPTSPSSHAPSPYPPKGYSPVPATSPSAHPPKGLSPAPGTSPSTSPSSQSPAPTGLSPAPGTSPYASPPAPPAPGTSPSTSPSSTPSGRSPVQAPATTPSSPGNASSPTPPPSSQTQTSGPPKSSAVATPLSLGVLGVSLVLALVSSIFVGA